MLELIIVVIHKIVVHFYLNHKKPMWCECSEYKLLQIVRVFNIGNIDYNQKPTTYFKNI